MQISQMQNCCGAYLITNFGHSSTNGSDWGNNYKPTIQEVSEYLKERTNNKGKLYVAYITKEQHTAIGKALTDNGFKRTSKSYHPDHNSIIYQYTKSNNGVK